MAKAARRCAQSRATVETEPADPQQPGADHREREIERREIFMSVATALAEDQSRDKARDARVHVHNQPAGKVNHARMREKAAAPHPVRDRHIDDEQPEHAEPQERREAQAVCNRARDQRDCDDREGHLIHHEQAFQDGRRQRRRGVQSNSQHERALQRADHRALARKRKGIGKEDPEKRNEKGRGSDCAIVASTFFLRTMPA
jgi:hypothetical protein